jgi:alkylated DNA repair dioxygenase AlkB
MLKNVLASVKSVTGNVPYNAVLVRLYFDGNDNIAWHTDGRTFLGKEPTIASLSLGATAQFSLRRMHNVWPCTGTPHGGVDTSEPQRHVTLKGGSLLVMKGTTQAHWHHMVPKEKVRDPQNKNGIRTSTYTEKQQLWAFE